MSTEFETVFYDALLGFLKSNGVEATAVTGFDDRTEWGGGCETCEYQYVVMDIYYTDNAGRFRTYTYDGGFSSLISEL